MGSLKFEDLSFGVSGSVGSTSLSLLSAVSLIDCLVLFATLFSASRLSAAVLSAAASIVVAGSTGCLISVMLWVKPVVCCGVSELKGNNSISNTATTATATLLNDHITSFLLLGFAST